MDVNAIWVPEALEATATILAALPSLGLRPAAIDSLVPGLGEGALGRYLRDTLALRRAVETWRGAAEKAARSDGAVFEDTRRPIVMSLPRHKWKRRPGDSRAHREDQ